jgi:hypothetical protein
MIMEIIGFGTLAVCGAYGMRGLIGKFPVRTVKEKKTCYAGDDIPDPDQEPRAVCEAETRLTDAEIAACLRAFPGKRFDKK